MPTGIVDVVQRAFTEVELPPGPFKSEADLRKFLWPAMRSRVNNNGVAFLDHAERVPDFVPVEQIRPDGVAERAGTSVAIELKLLRGRLKADAGELHRGLGQCLAYVASKRYRAGILLVVHANAIRPEAQGLSLLIAPGPICVATSPVRQVFMFNRWLPQP